MLFCVSLVCFKQKCDTLQYQDTFLDKYFHDYKSPAILFFFLLKIGVYDNFLNMYFATYQILIFHQKFPIEIPVKITKFLDTLCHNRVFREFMISRPKLCVPIRTSKIHEVTKCRISDNKDLKSCRYLLGLTLIKIFVCRNILVIKGTEA